MFAWWTALKDATHPKLIAEVSIYNKVFQLHRITGFILIALSLLVTTGVYFSDQTIRCFTPNLNLRDEESDVERLIDMYCWIHSTYTVEGPPENGTEKVLEAHPGVRQYTGNESRVYHKYYQWVCFVLFFQGLAFRGISFLWKNFEGGHVKSLTANMSDLCNEDKFRKRNRVYEYLQKTRGWNQVYAAGFIFCEVLNFTNVMVQLSLTDRFVGYAFSFYGFDVIKFLWANPLTRTDPMTKAFPKVTKCTIPIFGPGGNIMPYDSICVLPINMYNEKIYFFLWFWLYLLACISLVSLIYRLATLLSPKFRFWILRRTVGVDDETKLRELNDLLRTGDWFLIILMMKNMGPFNSQELVENLHARFVFDAPKSKAKDQ